VSSSMLVKKLVAKLRARADRADSAADTFRGLDFECRERHGYLAMVLREEADEFLALAKEDEIEDNEAAWFRVASQHNEALAEIEKARTALGQGANDSRWRPGETAVDALIREWLRALADEAERAK